VKKTTSTQNGYWTIEKGSDIEHIVRKSRFICYIRHVTSREGAQIFLNETRQAHRDAVHHCFAYRVGELGLESRMSDDGEPSGTAGKPILFCLLKSNVTNVICVIVRYFGGTKLGVGPLARAYSDACSMGLQACQIEFKKEMTAVNIYCEFDDVSRIITLLDEIGAEYTQEFTEVVTFTVSVPTLEFEVLASSVTERTSARAGISKIAT